MSTSGSSGSSIEEMTSDSGGSSSEGVEAGEALVLEGSVKLENPHQGTGSDVAEIGTSDGNASDSSVSSSSSIEDVSSGSDIESDSEANSEATSDSEAEIDSDSSG